LENSSFSAKVTVQTRSQNEISCLALKSARAFKHHAPKPAISGGKCDEWILQRWRENDTLQPLCPCKPSRKYGITIAGDFLAGFIPCYFVSIPCSERFNRQFRRLESHGHAIAGNWWNHGNGITDANFGARRGLLWTQGNSGHGTK
jgi:hypothetical protein